MIIKYYMPFKMKSKLHEGKYNSSCRVKGVLEAGD